MVAITKPTNATSQRPNDCQRHACPAVFAAKTRSWPATSAVGGPAGVSVPLVSGKAMCQPHAKRALTTKENVTVKSDGRDQQSAGQRLVPEGGYARGDQRLVDRVQQDRAERSPNNCPATTENRHTAHDNGRHHQ